MLCNVPLHVRSCRNKSSESYTRESFTATVPSNLGRNSTLSPIKHSATPERVVWNFFTNLLALLIAPSWRQSIYPHQNNRTRAVRMIVAIKYESSSISVQSPGTELGLLSFVGTRGTGCYVSVTFCGDPSLVPPDQHTCPKDLARLPIHRGMQ
jgi:hypothetical protein